MDLDLHDQLSHGFGPEPTHRPVGQRLAAGRRVVGRRRLAAAGAALGAVAVLGTGVAFLVHDSGPGRVPVATDPTTLEVPSEVPTPVTTVDPATLDRGARQFLERCGASVDRPVRSPSPRVPRSCTG